MGNYYRINQYIQAKEVRVVDETGRQVGVMPIFNAIQKAREVGVDLIEVAPNAKPPVCKIIDFKKFKYLEAKKEREEKKGQKGGELKEVRFTPFIAQNDLNIRIKKIKGFLADGDKVKIRIRFTGREMTKKDFGYKIVNQITQTLEGEASQEGEPKFQGRELFLILSPKKPSVKKVE
ncbi:MAG: translation initiation factor IF-3 [Patescibacteria group bacterium]|nr:translation initiation factor IF-3 [Patescibacteria group bacterium]